MQHSQLASPRPVTPHGILAKKLEALAQQVDSLLDNSATDGKISTEAAFKHAAFKQELKLVAQLATGLEPYIEENTSPESSALSALTQRTQSENWTQRFEAGETGNELEQEMLSGHTEGQFLKMLLHAISAKRVLEIGLFTGYSALAMAEELPADGVLIACELDAYAAQFAQSCFDSSPHGHKITVKVGPAIHTVKELAKAGEPFDFVFIDANKDGYLEYLDVLLESNLLADRALVCVDNTLMQGQPYMPGESTANGKAIAHFNEAIAKDPRLHQVILPVRDGVTLIRRS